MRSSHSDQNFTNYPIRVRHATEAIRVTLYRLKCVELVTKWYCVLDYNALDEW